MPNSISIPHHVQSHALYTWHLTVTPDQLLYMLDHKWLKQTAHAVFAEATSTLLNRNCCFDPIWLRQFPTSLNTVGPLHALGSNQ